MKYMFFISTPLLVFTTFILLSPLSMAKTDSEVKNESTVSDSDELISQLNKTSLTSLLDIDVELNPDWQASSPTKQAKKSS